MENQRVHEYSVQTGANGLPIAQLGTTHNLITFCESGRDKIHYFDGKWVSDNGSELDPATIPQHMKDQVASIPFNPMRDGTPDILVNCEFCEFTGAGREYARHLIEKHVPKATAKPAAAAPAPVVETVKLKPEDLPAGNYVTDDEGFVVMNADGTPRRKAGRPAANKE